MDIACDKFNKYYADAIQAQHFHTQLAIYISKLTKVTNDYILARKIEKETLIKCIHVSKPSGFGVQVQKGSNIVSSKAADNTQLIKISKVHDKKEKTIQLDEPMIDLPEEGKAARIHCSIDSNTIKITTSDSRLDTTSVSQIIPTIPEKAEDPSSEILLGYKKGGSQIYLEYSTQRKISN